MAAEGVARSDAQASNSAANRNLFKARVPIYPKLVHGAFRKLKWLAMAVTLAIYYLVPWIRWDRGAGLPDQAVLVDLTRERLYFFFIEIWPQEVYYITGLLILSAVSLFLVNALFGRLWCGYTCPQTVWTDLFIYVEDLIEGDRSARIRLAKVPWAVSKLAKRVAKHGIWVLISVMTGGAWIFYFTDAPTLAVQLANGSASVLVYGTIAGLAFTTYSLGGLMREQVCTYMCPWPRIQAAMSDRESLAVTYRSDRGEPRGAHRKGQPWDNRGSCIDCNQCVAACPMGIDIRDGAQLECINCGLCIDACDDVMGRIGQPLRLIAYDTDANVVRRTEGEKPVFHFIRTRIVLYVAVLMVVSAIMLLTLATRNTMDLDVLRDRNPNFVTLAEGSVRNAYTLKVMNRFDANRDLDLTVGGVQAQRITVIGSGDAVPPVKLQVEADKVRTVRVLVTLAKDAIKGVSQPVWFQLTDPITHETYRAKSVFVSGAP